MTPFIGLLGGAVGVAGKLAGGAINLLSGKTKQQRQQIKAAKAEAKQAEIDKLALKIKGQPAAAPKGKPASSPDGPAGNGILSKVLPFVKRYWWAILAAVVVIWFLFFRKKRRQPPRRRSRVAPVMKRRAPSRPARRKVLRRKR